MSEQRITKVKFGDELVITLEERRGPDQDRQIVIKSREQLHNDLLAARDALERHLREIIEIDSRTWNGAVVITGATWSLSETTGVEGACIVAQVNLGMTQSPLNIVTPHLPFDQYSEGGNAPLMPDAAQAALDELRAELHAFIDGKRAQGSLNFGEAAS